MAREENTNKLNEWPPEAIKELCRRISLGVMANEREQLLLKEIFRRIEHGEFAITTEEAAKICKMPYKDSTTGTDNSPIYSLANGLRGKIEDLGKDSLKEIGLSLTERTYTLRVLSVPPSEWMTKNTPLVGILFANVSDWFVGNYLRGVIPVCRKAGYDVIVDNSEDKVRLEAEKLREMVEKVSGLIVVPVGDHLFDRQTANILKRKPCVLADRYLHSISDIPFVHHDDISAGRQAAEYLIASGCERILIFNQGTEEGEQQKVTPLQDRERGCHLGASKHLERHVDVVTVSVLDAGEKGGYDALKRFSDKGRLRQSDGIFALTDKVALGCLHFLRRAGGKWPNLPLIAFEGQRFGEYVDPQIASIDGDSTEVARLAAEILVKKLENVTLPESRCFPHFLVTPWLLEPSDLLEARTSKKIHYPDAETRYLGDEGR